MRRTVGETQERWGGGYRRYYSASFMHFKSFFIRKLRTFDHRYVQSRDTLIILCQPYILRRRVIFSNIRNGEELAGAGTGWIWWDQEICNQSDCLYYLCCHQINNCGKSYTPCLDSQFVKSQSSLFNAFI